MIKEGLRHCLKEDWKRLWKKAQVMRMGEKVDTQITIPSGSLALDACSWVGGYPRDELLLKYMDQKVLVTTVHFMLLQKFKAWRNACTLMLKMLWIRLAEALGVDIDSLILSQISVKKDYKLQILIASVQLIFWLWIQLLH